MFEKVNPNHPDKVADRIAGAIVDLAYKQEENPKIAVEVLIGHGKCHAIIETGTDIDKLDVENAIQRIAGNVTPDVVIVKQDAHLAKNQADKVRCGDNGIFKGVPVSREQVELAELAREIYDAYETDGKYILTEKDLIICQSNAEECDIRERFKLKDKVIINPLGSWTGGPDVDTGATNRKLGSDMGDGVTGGGLHGKDLSKADVSVNIYAHLRAQCKRRPVQLYCAIGDETIDGRPYQEIVNIARKYIESVGGFEKFAEWGLI